MTRKSSSGMTVSLIRFWSLSWKTRWTLGFVTSVSNTRVWSSNVVGPNAKNGIIQFAHISMGFISTWKGISESWRSTFSASNFLKKLDNISQPKTETSSTKYTSEGSFATTKRPLTWPRKSSTKCIWKNSSSWTRAVPENFTSKQTVTLCSRNPKFSPFQRPRLPHPYLITSCRQSNVTLHKTTLP